MANAKGERETCSECGNARFVLRYGPVAGEWTDGTVDFLAAMKAAREGKKVRPVGEEDWKYWAGGNLRTDDFEKPRAFICERYLDARWEIEQPPPREYTFIEAVEMMKAGKKMRPTIVIENGCEFSAIDGWFHYENPQLGHKRRFSHLCVEWITSPWVQA
jgi:hypothetical protein